ncbi:MAG: HAD family hydrolase [Terriglobales bacterium]
MSTRLKNIFFDVGNTLLYPDRAHILAPLAKLGYSPTLEQWHTIERLTKKQFDEALQRDHSADFNYWLLFYERLLAELGVNDDRVRDFMVDATRTSANWRVIRPGTRELLLELSKRYSLAVISNADGKIEDVLKRCGIADCFASITDSGLVGYEKPHPAIFEAALQAMKAKPSESLYVGDVYAVDYLGATRVGMQAMLIDVSGAYRDAGLPRIEALEELAARIG